MGYGDLHNPGSMEIMAISDCSEARQEQPRAGGMRPANEPSPLYPLRGRGLYQSCFFSVRYGRMWSIAVCSPIPYTSIASRRLISSSYILSPMTKRSSLKYFIPDRENRCLRLMKSPKGGESHCDSATMNDTKTFMRRRIQCLRPI